MSWSNLLSTPSLIDRVAFGTLAAATIAAVARRQRALSPAGAVAATAVGGAVVVGGGWRMGASLVAFFSSSSLLGRLPRGNSDLEQQRGNERDVIQVLANGAVSAVLAVASGAVPSPLRPLLRCGAAGAIAAAAADTWATEIGSRSRQYPRSLTTRRPMPRGASGGVTVVGLAASLGGAALAAVPLMVGGQDRFDSPLPIILGGIAGSLVDSLLGATWQEVRICDLCGKETEQRIHRCGTPTRRLRGRHWCDNDVVNAMAGAAGALTAMALSARQASPRFDRARSHKGRVRSPARRSAR
jgi:uncharacterized protein (TIGR00297 family)